MNGVRNISPVIRKAARVMRLTPAQTIRNVLLPPPCPNFLRHAIGVSLALLGTLVGECSHRIARRFMLIQSVEHAVPPSWR